MKERFESFDYGRMAREAWDECQVLRGKMLRLKAIPKGTADDEICKKRRLAVLYGIYLEQRGSYRLFSQRAYRRRQSFPHGPGGGVSGKFPDMPRLWDYLEGSGSPAK